MLKRR
jgi:hypothetical protein